MLIIDICSMRQLILQTSREMMKFGKCLQVPTALGSAACKKILDLFTTKIREPTGQAWL